MGALLGTRRNVRVSTISDEILVLERSAHSLEEGARIADQTAEFSRSRMAAARLQFISDVETLLATLCEGRANCLSRATASNRGVQKKLAASSDDAEALASLLDAASALCANPCIPLQTILLDLIPFDALPLLWPVMRTKSLSRTFADFAHACARSPIEEIPGMLIPQSTCCLSSLSFSHVVADDASAVELELGGSGLRCFAAGLDNVVTVTVRNAAGALNSSARPSDIKFCVFTTSNAEIDASVRCAGMDVGSFVFVYTISDASAREVLLHVSAFNGSCKTKKHVRCAYSGGYRVDALFPLGTSLSRFDAMYFDVSLDGLLCCVSCPAQDAVRLYKIHPKVKLIAVLHRPGRGIGEFLCPKGVCFTKPSSRSVLVCDPGSHRVQEVTFEGYVCASLKVACPKVIAFHSNSDPARSTVAVGCSNETIKLYSYPAFELLRVICDDPDDKDIDISLSCHALCFTPDGSALLFAEYGRLQATLIDVKSGAVLQRYGRRIMSLGYWAVAISHACVICVGEAHQLRVVDVFDRNSSQWTPHSTWASTDVIWPVQTRAVDVQPAAAVVRGPTLYILDAAGCCIVLLS